MTRRADTPIYGAFMDEGRRLDDYMDAELEAWARLVYRSARAGERGTQALTSRGAKTSRAQSGARTRRHP